MAETWEELYKKWGAEPPKEKTKKILNKKILIILCAIIVVIVAFTFANPLEIKEAKFVTSNLAVPKDITIGKPFVVSLDVENVGKAEGNYTASLMLGGTIADSRLVSLKSGEKKTINFTVTSTVGNHTIKIGNIEKNITAIDTIPPDIIIASPKQTTYGNVSIKLDVSANEAINTWLYSLNAGYKISFTPNITITASEGSNNITVWANDSFGNTASKTVYFNISLKDTEPPILTVVHSPSEPNASDIITFTVIASDNVGIKEIKIYIDNANVKNCISSPCIYSTTLSAGAHSYYASTSDAAGNLAKTETKSLTVKTTTIPTPTFKYYLCACENTVTITPTPTYGKMVVKKLQVLNKNPIVTGSVEINATVQNEGGTPMSSTVYFIVQGELPCKEDIVLKVGESKELTCTTKLTYGESLITVGELTVKVGILKENLDKIESCDGQLWELGKPNKEMPCSITVK